MASYGTVNTIEDDDDTSNDRRWDDWIWNFLKGGTLSHDERLQLQNRLTELGGPRNSETFLVHAESVRQIAYVIFWLMIAVSAIITKFMIPSSQIEHSDLKRIFGYNNVRSFRDKDILIASYTHVFNDD
jgi:hypothetical protein